MGSLKVCFAGIGSIAKRHIRNLVEVCSERGFELSIDALRREESYIEYIDRVFTDVKELPSDYDVIFITNPTECHLETLEKLHDKGENFFIEKPVVSPGQIDMAIRLQCRNESVYYVACPLRYNSVIQWIKDSVDVDDVIAVRSISSSYLPQWRPGQDYRTTYSAHKAMGGGVSIDLIHEWDYLTYLFGWPNKVYSLIGKKSELEIDSDDHALYIADYDHMTVELHLDYYGRESIRQIQLFTRNDTIDGDILNGRITRLVRGDIIELGGERDDYQKKELNHFLDMVIGKVSADEMNNYGYDHGLRVLGLTQGILQHESTV